MAPKRKSTAPRTASRQSSQQATLSFHGKPNKITKSSGRQQDKVSKKDPALVEDVVRTDVLAEAQPDLDEPTTAQEVIENQATEEVEVLKDPLEHDGEATTEEIVLGGRAQESDVGALGGKGAGWVGDEEEQARKVSDTQIKRYWRAKEQERLAPRVHQEDLSVYEKVLREWDMSGQYGVSRSKFTGREFCDAIAGTDDVVALYRHCTAEAMEARQPTRPEAAD